MKCLLPLVALIACDSAHDDRFRGEPLFAVGGRVVLVGEAPPAWTETVNLRASLRWTLPNDVREQPRQQADVSVAFPTDMELAVFTRPPREIMQTFLPLSGRIAVGQVIVYDDADDDGAWDAGTETLFGVSPVAITFAEHAVVGPRITVPAGFALMLLGGCSGDHGLVGVPVSELRIPIFVAGKDLAEAGIAQPSCHEQVPVFCAGLAARRERCRLDPDLLSCTECAKGIFPEHATPIECDVWRERCVFDGKFDPIECDSEWRICHCAGNAPDEPCSPYGL